MANPWEPIDDTINLALKCLECSKLQKENDDIWKVSKMMEANYLDAKKENALLKITIENLKASQSKVLKNV